MNVSIRRQNHDQQQQYSIYSPTAINLLYEFAGNGVLRAAENAGKDNGRQRKLQG